MAHGIILVSAWTLVSTKQLCLRLHICVLGLGYRDTECPFVLLGCQFYVSWYEIVLFYFQTSQKTYRTFALQATSDMKLRPNRRTNVLWSSSCEIPIVWKTRVISPRKASDDEKERGYSEMTSEVLPYRNKERIYDTYVPLIFIVI